jgi:hypothetical protein
MVYIVKIQCVQITASVRSEQGHDIAFIKSRTISVCNIRLMHVWNRLYPFSTVIANAEGEVTDYWHLVNEDESSWSV